MQTLRLTTRALLVLAIAAMPIASLAAPLVDFSGGFAEQVASPPRNYGFDFTVQSGQFEITGLGVFESSQKALTGSHDVGLWDASGTLLASVTGVDGADALVAAATTIGDYRVIDITPLLLSPGQYFVGANYATGDTDDVLIDATAIPVAGITYGSARYNFDSTLTRPTESWGVSLVGGVVVGHAVPEPATLALLGLGLAGLAASRRRKQ